MHFSIWIFHFLFSQISLQLLFVGRESFVVFMAKIEIAKVELGLGLGLRQLDILFECKGQIPHNASANRDKQGGEKKARIYVSLQLPVFRGRTELLRIFLSISAGLWPPHVRLVRDEQDDSRTP